METLADLGLIGLFIGAFLAATILPFSADILIIAALIAGLNPVAIFFSSTTGSWVGSVTTYWLGYLGKWEWIEKWFKITPEALKKQQARITKWGAPLALLAWLPFVGDLFSLGFGFFKVPFVKVTIYTFIGKALRSAFWIFLYMQFGVSLLK